MSPLPNRLDLDLRKIEDYCLNPDHPRGRHKARVFREALGIGRSDAAWLRSTLLSVTSGDDAVHLDVDAFGQRWRIDVNVTRQERRAVIRTVWIQRSNEDFARFVTCWVL